jgi:chromosome segregation ATPase
MIAALTPVQTGVEQLWALAVSNFRSVLEKMHAGFVDAIQNERATGLAFKAELEKQQAENARLQDKIGSLEKEVKEVKEALLKCSGEMVMAQQETARLAGEKGWLEIKLKSVEVVLRRLASQGFSINSFSSSSTSTSASSEPDARTTTNSSLMEIVQKEVSDQVNFKLQAAFRDVQQQRAMREQAERKMQALMKKVKASVRPSSSASFIHTSLIFFI